MIGGLQGENGDLNIKYLKKKSKSVGRKYLEALRRILQACKMGCEISQVEGLHFAAKGWFRSHHLVISQLQNWPSAWCDWLPIAITSSFQLRFAHCLKRWISDFPSFKTKYSMHEMSSRKCSKSVQHLLSSWILHVRFLSLLSLLAFMICLWKRTIKLQSLSSSC